MEKNELTLAQAFEMMGKDAGFSVEPCASAMDFEDKSRYTRLNLDATQRAQMSALIQQMPQAIAAGTLKQAYIVKFPEGLPHTLSKFQKGGYSTIIRANGKIAGHASFYPIEAQALALGVFSAMSAVTGQYFLTEINHELKLVNEKLDDILSFLYGDKKAELMAEIGFVKYAHANFSTIMQHEQQRLATITSLQEARKVALKDIEFYLNDLDAITGKGTGDFAKLRSHISDAYRAKDCIEMARQLYVISSLLELYYAQNYDDPYMHYLESDMIAYINRCDARIVSAFSALEGKVTGYKPNPFEKVSKKDKNEINQGIEGALELYKNANDSPIRVSLEKTLTALHRPESYYVDSEGQLYVKK